LILEVIAFNYVLEDSGMLKLLYLRECPSFLSVASQILENSEI